MAYIGLSEYIDFDKLPDPSGRLRLDEVIGEGTYGEVYQAFDLETGQKVAVKIMEQIVDNIEEIEEEFLILRDLCIHPNIPSFHGLYFKRHPSKRENDQLWFVMELCAGGSVTDLVHNLRRYNKRLSEETIAFIIRETTEALAFLHRNHCMHRDVKGHNILLTEDAEVKLIDYGVSSHAASTLDRKNTSVGTPYWMAPEVIACEQQLEYAYDMRCDVWSLGITAIELADGDPPLAELHPMRALFQIPRNPPPTLQQPGDWSAAFNDFIATCLAKDFEKRPHARALLEHPFLKQVPPNPDAIRYPLKRELARQSAAKAKRRAPEMTTKHGKLRADRKAKMQRIYLDDLAQLENFSIETLVDQLEKRYVHGLIYTYIGDILVALNPFQDLNIYTENEINMYRNQARSDNPPHVFAVADGSYHAMLHQRRSQCIVISGESGSGKTVTANLLLKQLVTLGKAPNRNLEEKILMMNPIMEAFGNAQTGINDNSSRFAKYLDVTFTASGMVSGARLSVYLLEHSRVVHQAYNEKNFHIFYYLCEGLAAESKLKQYYFETGKRSHRYLSLPPLNSSQRQANLEKFQLVRKGFQQLDFAADEVDAIYSILAAIIHLGDVELESTGSGTGNTDSCRVANLGQVDIVGRLLGIEQSAIVAALTSVSVVTRGETIQRHSGIEEACATRDAMAKGLYARLFDWLVQQINRHLSFGRIVYGEPLSVGLLDIFGFENHTTSGGRNSFEQLCINIANEQIQYFFNQHVFTWEQQEYMAEGINVDVIAYTDNRPVLDMFLAKPLGLLALLDEESRFPGATDSSLIEKFKSNIRSDYYIRHKSAGLEFTIQHYAGRVSYEASNFLEKNRNFFPPEIVQLLRSSKNPTVQFLFQCPLTKTGNLYSKGPFGSPNPGRKLINKERLDTNDFTTIGSGVAKGLASQTRAQQTVATYFRHSLMELLQKMIGGSSSNGKVGPAKMLGEPFFVRCIKPNDLRHPGHVDHTKLAQQLRYTGVLETVRIRKQGFSHRFTFADFLRRYCFLAFGFEERVVADRDTCIKLLNRLKLEGWAVGKSKVFLKYYHIEYLSKIYDQQIRRIIQVQACVRRWLAKIHHDRERQSKINLRSRNDDRMEVDRPFTGRRNAKDMNPDTAALVIQKNYRGYRIRSQYGDELLDRYQHNRTLQRKYGPPPYPDDENSVALTSPTATSLDEKTRNSIRRRRQEMMAFAAQIYKLSHESHQVFRRCKSQVQANQLSPPPSNYVRPNGFKIMPSLLAQQLASHKVASKPEPKSFIYQVSEPETPTSERAGSEIFDYENDPWDAPLKRAARDKDDRDKNKVDLNKEMLAQLDVGAHSQNRINMVRENQLLGQWRNLLKEAADRQQPNVSVGSWENQHGARGRPGKLFEKSPSGNGPVSWSAGSDGWEKKVNFANQRQSSKENVKSPLAGTPMRTGLQGVLRQTSEQDIQSPSSYRSLSSIQSPTSFTTPDGDTPFNFRAVLRKTEHAPTATLRKLKEQRSQESVEKS